MGFNTAISPWSPRTRALARTRAAGEERTGDPPGATVGKAEIGAHVAVHLRRREPRLGAHHGGLGTGEEANHVDRVTPHVHGGPAGQLEAEADVAGPDQRDAQMRLDVLDPSQASPVDDLLHARRQRVVALVEGLDEEASGLPGDSAIRSASAAFDAIGFSHRTCFPWRSARIVHSPWRPLGRGL